MSGICRGWYTNLDRQEDLKKNVKLECYNGRKEVNTNVCGWKE